VKFTRRCKRLLDRVEFGALRDFLVLSAALLAATHA